MKICDVTQFYSPVSGGVKRYLSEKVRYLQRHRPDCRHLLIIPGERDEVIRDAQSTVHVIGSPLISKTSRYRALLRLGTVEHILHAEQPDIIESGDPYQMAWAVQTHGRHFGIPVVGFYHSHFPEAYLRSAMKFFGRTAVDITMDISRRYIRTLYNRFDRTLVPSAALAALLHEWGVENTETMELGVDTEVFRPNPEAAARVRSDLGLSEGTCLLLYVGRLAPEKNTRTLFQAFQILHQKKPGRYHLMIVGDGTQRSLVMDLKASTGAVSWLSYCSDTTQLAALYNASDLFIHPGVLETFGLVALESQACGTPVVGIKGSYMDRIIFSDQSFWARDNHPAALCQAVEDATGENMAKVGDEAGERVRSVYSWDRVFSRMLESYTQLVRPPPIA